MRLLLLSLFLLYVISANAQTSKVTLQAAGLTCAMCSNAIYQSLIRLPFVEEVAPDVKSSSFVIFVKKEKNIDLQALRYAVEDAGFSVARLSWTIPKEVVNSHQDSPLKIQGVELLIINRNQNIKKDSVELVLMEKEFLTKKKYKEYRDAVLNLPKINSSPSRTYYAWIE